jgi:hypothetical protein
VNKFKVNAIALAIGLVSSAGAMARSMSKDQYKYGKDGCASGAKAKFCKS